jgi:hypothetical protein
MCKNNHDGVILKFQLELINWVQLSDAVRVNVLFIAHRRCESWRANPLCVNCVIISHTPRRLAVFHYQSRGGARTWIRSTPIFQSRQLHSHMIIFSLYVHACLLMPTASALFEGEKITIQQRRESCALCGVKFDARNHTEFIIWECARTSQESGTNAGKK